MKPQTFARQCSVTGALMNEGFVWYDGQYYTDGVSLTAKELREDYANGDIPLDDETELAKVLKMDDNDIIEYAYDNEILYYTEWDADDHQWSIDEQGNVTEIY